MTVDNPSEDKGLDKVQEDLSSEVMMKKVVQMEERPDTLIQAKPPVMSSYGEWNVVLP